MIGYCKVLWIAARVEHQAVCIQAEEAAAGGVEEAAAGREAQGLLGCEVQRDLHLSVLVDSAQSQSDCDTSVAVAASEIIVSVFTCARRLGRRPRR